MKPHLPLIILTCLSLQLSAQVKNTYSFAQGDTTQVTISWDTWAVTGDPILGCNIYRIENPDVPLNETLITSTDSTYQFIDDTEFDPDFPPKYTIMAIRSSDTVEVAYAHGFSSIEFYTLGTDSLAMEFIVWNTEMCCIGVNVFHDDILSGYTDYKDPFIITFPSGFFMSGVDNYKLRFISEYTPSYADVKLTADFITYFLTTVGIPEIPKQVNQVSIYPSPANENITFAFENTEHHRNIELRCFNLLGMEQHQTKILRGQQQSSTNVSTWPPGMYVVVVYSEGRPVGRGKFVVQK